MTVTEKIAAPVLPTHRTRRRRPDIALVMAAVGALVGTAVFFATRSVMPDDAYLTLDVARSLGEHGVWGVLSDVPANTATSPLNVWLLAAQVWAGVDPVAAVGVLLAVTFALAGWWAVGLARALGRRPVPVAVVLLGLLACSPMLLSTVGLESYLGCAVLVGVARYAAARRPVATGVLLGLAVLTRPDLAVPAAVLCIGYLRRHHTQNRGAGHVALQRLLGPRLGIGQGRSSYGADGVQLPIALREHLGQIRHVLTVAVVAAVVALPWHLWAWFHLGGFLPDTTWLKTGGGEFEGYHLAGAWLLYGWHFPAATALAMGVVVLAVLCVPLSVFGWREFVPLLAGAAHLAAMIAIGAGPFAWYYVPALAGATMTVALVAGRGGWSAVATRACAGLLVVASVGFLAQTPWQVAPIIYNFGSSAQYEAIGRQVRAIVGPDANIQTHVEMGALAYGCDCRLLSDALTDPSATDLVLADRFGKSGELGRTIMAWDTAYRPPHPQPELSGWRVYAYGEALPPIPGHRWVWPIGTAAHGQNYVILDRP